MESIDAEIEFSKKLITALFDIESMKKIKTVIRRNNFNKLKPLLTSIDNKIWRNCLIYSIHYNLEKIFKKIINNSNVNIDIMANNFEILKYCIYYRNMRMINKLLCYDVATYINFNDAYALVRACKVNDIEMVKLLVNNGADVYAQNCISIISASVNGCLEIVELLLEKMSLRKLDGLDGLDNLDITNFDISMISAVRYKYECIARRLLEVGANVNINNSEALIVAAENGDAQMVKLLLAYGADANARDGDVLKRAIKSECLEVVSILVNYKNDVGDCVCDLSKGNSRALRWAVFRGNYEITKLLLESKNANGEFRCDVQAEDNDAMRLAKKYDHQNIVELLEAHNNFVGM